MNVELLRETHHHGPLAQPTFPPLVAFIKIPINRWTWFYEEFYGCNQERRRKTRKTNVCVRPPPDLFVLSLSVRLFRRTLTHDDRDYESCTCQRSPIKCDRLLVCSIDEVSGEQLKSLNIPRALTLAFIFAYVRVTCCNASSQNQQTH